MNKDAKEMISMKGTWRRPAAKKVPIQREMNNIRVREDLIEYFVYNLILYYVIRPHRYICRKFS